MENLEKIQDIKLFEARIKEQMRMILKGAAQVVHAEILEDKLRRSQAEGRPLRVKLGLDPSAPDIHLGHAVVLRKIRQLQNLGHQVTIVIGDFTGKIGDPTGKTKGRKALTDEQVRTHAETYTQQIFKVLDPARTEVRFNSEWLSKLNFEEVLKLAATSTVARMMEREDFANRFKNGVPIGLHEFFYPLMQAYDSVALQADLELGGTDQTFNILMGRTLQRHFEQEEQVALFMPILEGLDGIEKMSKSLGNYIGVSDPAEIMFKKVMEVPDHLIVKYFELATDEDPNHIEEIRQALASGKNPRDVKLELAEIITGLYHTPEIAAEARNFFVAAFQKNCVPENVQELHVEEIGLTLPLKLMDLSPLLVRHQLVASNSAFKRLIVQGGVQVEGVKMKEGDHWIHNPVGIRIGKKGFVRISK